MHYIIEEEAVTTSLPHGSLPVSKNPEVGFRPLELFVTSLAGCSGTLLRNLLQKKRISYQGLTMDVDVTRDTERANRITKLHFTVEMDGEISEKQASSIAELVLKNCGMIQSVIDSIEITFELTRLSSNE